MATDDIETVREALTALRVYEHQYAGDLHGMASWTALARIEARIGTLGRALDRAGTRLAQVQPAIDVSCTWALDIVPAAEREIAEALDR